MIGVDIVKAERILGVFEKDSNNKVFTQREVEYINQKSTMIGNKVTQKASTIAGIYAAKEAFLKAFGLGLGEGINLFEIEIDHKQSGQPFIVINHKIKSYLELSQVKTINVSISHDGEYAVAVVEIL